MRTTLEKPEIIKLIAKGLGLKNLSPEMVHVQAEPFEVTITHDALATAIPAQEMVKEVPNPSISSEHSVPQNKQLRRPVLTDTPLKFSHLMDHNHHVPRPDVPQTPVESKERLLHHNEYTDIGPTTKDGRESDILK